MLGTYIKGNKKFMAVDRPEGLIFVDGDITLRGSITSNNLNNPNNLITTIISNGKITILGNWNTPSAEYILVLIAKDGVDISGSNNLSGVIYSENRAVSSKRENTCQG